MISIKNLLSLNVFEFLQKCSSKLSRFAAEKEIQEWILFGVVLVASVLIGLFAFKLAKLLLAAAAAGGGYILATRLFWFIEQKKDMPDWLLYVLGAILAVAMAVLAFQKYHYAFFTVSAGAVFCVSMYYFGDSLVLAGGIALLVAFIAVYFVRGCFVLASSLLASAATVTCTAALLPDLAWLQVGAKSWGFICITLALAIVYAIIQFASNRRYSL